MYIMVSFYCSVNEHLDLFHFLNNVHVPAISMLRRTYGRTYVTTLLITSASGTAESYDSPGFSFSKTLHADFQTFSDGLVVMIWCQLTVAPVVAASIFTEGN